MRLLHTATLSNGAFRLTDDIIRVEKIPPYAILSHTWGEEEVLFDDLKSLDNVKNVDLEKKAGWEKIRFCAKQAECDGLDYFWVDTCCIDKKNNTELSEAINSMFRWYQNAGKCYVFLSDVEGKSSERMGQLSSRLEGAFMTSRWFTRGWTLQELLAPRSVDFFSKDGAWLGNKESLKQTIHEITKLPIETLSADNLSKFNATERFSWAEHRETTREEDVAYCLFGLLGCHLPPLYGEGRENALKRLRKQVLESSEDARTRDRNQKQRLSKICSWLSAPDPSANYHKAHKERQAQTGLWLLESAKFSAWKESTASQLWLYGIPGCGKTILSSTIIEHLLQHCHDDTSVVTVYFYFDFKDTQKQDPELMLYSLLCQLLQRSIAIHNSVDALFSSCGDGRQKPSLYALLDVTRQVAQEFAHVYVVLDALDECTQRPELLDILETVVGWQLDNLHLLMTSRKERDIEISVEQYVKDENAVCLERDVVDQDIQQYVQQRLHDDRALAKWDQDPAIRQEIEAALMRGARGMFRWAVCQLDTLGKCRNRAMLRKSLVSLPRTLDQTYDRILCAIDEEDSQYATRILQWLTFSERPLSIKEIAEVVAIDVERDPAFDRNEVLEDPLETLNICSSLVTLVMFTEDGEDSPVRQLIALAHYSVQEYLVSDRIQQGPAKQYSMQEAECHNAITKGSLKYLLQFQQPLSEKVLKKSALALYSAEFWSSHLRKTGAKMEEASQLAMVLMAKEEPAYLNWIQLHDPDQPWKTLDVERSVDSIHLPLYYAAMLGLSTITRLLLDKGANVNAQGGVYSNALQAASSKGHKQIVKLLLDSSANVNAQGGLFSNALEAASSRGYEQIVNLLLNRGAGVNAQGRYFGNALQAASNEGHEQIVKLLLNRGADVNVQGGKYGNALQAASIKGQEQAVKLLLERGAEVNAQGGYYGNALQAASCGDEGSKQIVQILLDSGADVNAQGGVYGSALQAASSKGEGSKQIVQMLLENGADVNAQGGHFGNALQAASIRGHKQIVKLLLNRGADVNVQGGKYGNALQAAWVVNSQQIVELLLEKGAKKTLPKEVKQMDSGVPDHQTEQRSTYEEIKQRRRLLQNSGLT